MNRFYFTYGSEGQPYVGGWSIVWAENFDQACEIFCAVHPRQGGCINCAGIYDEDDFESTKMYEKQSNLGAGCHEIIKLSIYRMS